jgi:hypothetical protein
MWKKVKSFLGIGRTKEWKLVGERSLQIAHDALKLVAELKEMIHRYERLNADLEAQVIAHGVTHVASNSSSSDGVILLRKSWQCPHDHNHN